MTPADRPRVAVVGVGSVGGYFGAMAAIAGCEVLLCPRRPFDELVVLTDGQRLVADATVLSGEPAAEEVGPVDWVLLATKAHQTAGVAGWLKALSGSGTVVVVLQNGVDHLERVAPLTGDAEVLPAIVKYGGELLEPGVVRHHTYGYLTVPESPTGARLSELFAPAGVEVKLTAAFDTAAWTKLATNVIANAIPALTMRRFDVFRRDDIAGVAEQVVAECVAVASAVGVRLPRSLPTTEVTRLASLPDGVGSSMLYDRLAGRTTEHETLNGAVVRMGAQHGVPTPLNAALTAMLAAISDSARPTDATPPPDHPPHR